MKRLLLLGCISSMYCSQVPYQDILIDSINEREVTYRMMTERSKVLHRRMIMMQPYVHGDAVYLKSLAEYERIKQDNEMLSLFLEHLKENINHK